MTRAEAYEPFYQFLREPSNSEKWKALRGLVDNLMTETKKIGFKQGFEHGADFAYDRVLEIIDSEAWSYCDYIIRHKNGNGDMQQAASALSDNIREAVKALEDNSNTHNALDALETTGDKTE